MLKIVGLLISSALGTLPRVCNNTEIKQSSIYAGRHIIETRT